MTEKTKRWKNKNTKETVEGVPYLNNSSSKKGVGRENIKRGENDKGNKEGNTFHK